MDEFKLRSQNNILYLFYFLLLFVETRQKKKGKKWSTNIPFQVSLHGHIRDDYGGPIKIP
jgi:hypothetical protein